MRFCHMKFSRPLWSSAELNVPGPLCFMGLPWPTTLTSQQSKGNDPPLVLVHSTAALGLLLSEQDLL